MFVFLGLSQNEIKCKESGLIGSAEERCESKLQVEVNILNKGRYQNSQSAFTENWKIPSVDKFIEKNTEIKILQTN